MGQRRRDAWILASVVLTACAAPPRAAHEPGAAPALVATELTTAAPSVATGRASWYGRFHHGRRTASGERFDMYALTAAHRTLPLGTRLRVVNLENGRAVDVRINDRGPVIHDRIIDLSYAAARRLGGVEAGVFRVSLAPLPKR